MYFRKKYIEKITCVKLAHVARVLEHEHAIRAIHEYGHILDLNDQNIALY